MPRIPDYTQPAVESIRHLAHDIGGRGSCTPAERQAAEYIIKRLQQIGARDVCMESFCCSASTYRPFVLSFAAALAGSLLAWLAGYWGLIAGVALNALGAWGMYAETDFTPNWTRRFGRQAASQNALGVLPARGVAKRIAILCAHLDTHRTPIFYSGKTWYRLFGLLVAAAFASMPINALFYLLSAVRWESLRWFAAPFAALQLFALLLCLHADRTPFSPGANDNASGVGAVLDLAQRLHDEPLQHTEVWLVFTGCEETGAYGIADFLDRHAGELGGEAVIIVLDEVGRGQLNYLTADGLIRKRPTHPDALALARRASIVLPDLEIVEKVGLAYTDALVATRRGLAALSINALPAADDRDGLHWHCMSDTYEKIDPQTLAAAQRFTWQVLQEIDMD